MKLYRTILAIILVLLQVHFVIAQTAVILPPGETTFFDANGNPLTSGTVDFYNPGTTVRATTWIDPNKTTPNTNPVILDAAGRAIIWGQGTYRQIVKDRLGNLIWDQLTSDGLGSSGATNFGDGNAVGTVKAWAGVIAPAQYLFAYGQQVSRTTYSALLSTITLTINVTCTSGSSTLSSISDTSSISVGSVVEVSCIPGSAVVNSVTSSTVVVSSPANISTSVNATFFPFGNGNGSSTFSLPDLRGYVIAGRDNMGGTAASRLTAPYYGVSADALGAVGGSQNQTLTLAQIASHTHNVLINDPGHYHDLNYGTTFATASNNNAVTPIGGTTNFTETGTSTTGITATNTSSGGGIAVSASLNATSGIAVSSSIAAAGSGYPNSSAHTLTINGGTCSVQPIFNVTTTSGSGVTQLNSINNPGNCTVAPTNPASTTISTGGGSGATVNVAFVGTSAVLSTIPNNGAGSGYSSGTQTLTLVGGSCLTQPQVNVLIASNALAAVSSIATPGFCTQFPPNPIATTGGGGTGGTLNIAWNNGVVGWTNGSRVVTVQGGTCTSQPQFNATVVNGTITTIGAVQNAGNCSVTPVNPALLVDAGGIASSASISNGGSGYTNGSQVLTVQGGTCSVQPSFNVTVTANTVVSVNSLNNAGNCTISPANPAATMGGGGVAATLSVTYSVGGTGAQANVVYSAQPIPIIQPTITLNYVIKVLPDTSLSTTNVVTSIGGVTGAFTCGANMICIGNVISSTGSGGIISGTPQVGYIPIATSPTTAVWGNLLPVSNDLSTSGLFGPPVFQVIAGGLNQNAIVGQAIQNQASVGFPTGVTGYGKLTNSGNQVFGVYGRADCTVAGGCNNEFDVNNNSSNDSPTTVPIANSFGTSATWPVDIFIAAGGSKKSYAGIYMTGVPGSANQFQYGIYMDKSVINTTGILLDADATNSPTNSLVVKNTGLGSNIPVIIQTLGILNSSEPVLQARNIAGSSIWEIRQDGSTVTTNQITATLSQNASTTISVQNTNSGASTNASFNAISNAGIAQLTANSTAGSSVAALRWSGPGSLLVDAQNSAGNIKMRTGATPIEALNITSVGHLAVGATSAPTPTSCGGGSPSVSGTDTAGLITMGTTSTGCTVSFANTYTTVPFCVVTWQSNLAAMAYTVSASAITITQTSTSSNLINYHCIGTNGAS